MARVGHQHGIAAVKQPLAEWIDAEPVVDYTMKEKDGIAVWILRPLIPSFENGAVGRGERDILKFDRVCGRVGPGVALFIVTDGRTFGMEGNPPEKGTAEEAGGEVEGEKEVENAARNWR
jgi:hypothetical protein